VPYQDNGWDCGVYVCQYGFGIYAIFLRGHVVTYANIGDCRHPFCALISESHDFHFKVFDIVCFWQDLGTSLKKLSISYKEWKEACNKAKKKVGYKAGAKKPAACKLLLQGGDASTSPYTSVSPKTDPSLLMANVNVHSREGDMEGATMNNEHIIMLSPCDNANTTVSDAMTDAKNVGSKKKVESKYYALEYNDMTANDSDVN
jgi:hypothetical protein